MLAAVCDEGQARGPTEEERYGSGGSGRRADSGFTWHVVFYVWVPTNAQGPKDVAKVLNSRAGRSVLNHPNLQRLVDQVRC